MKGGGPVVWERFIGAAGQPNKSERTESKETQEGKMGFIRRIRRG